MKDRDIWIKLLKEKYPTKQAVCREIINLTAIINLPKGTEHFMSDIHGEYEAFLHIMNNCSGVIREKVRMLFSETLSVREQQEICTLIYYPREVMNRKRNLNELSEDWYRLMLNYLLELAKMVSSKYTRSKVRRALPKEFGDILTNCCILCQMRMIIRFAITDRFWTPLLESKIPKNLLWLWQS